MRCGKETPRPALKQEGPDHVPISFAIGSAVVPRGPVYACHECAGILTHMFKYVLLRWCLGDE